MPDHGGKKTWTNFFPAILYDGLPAAVVQCNVTPLAALGIDANGNLACHAEVEDPIEKFLALHDPYLGQFCPNVK